MGNRHLLHVKSSVVENGKAKLPTKDVLLYGELAINYAKDKETLSLRNSADEIVPLNFYDVNKMLASGITNINVNGIKGTVTTNGYERIASVVISGNNENVGTYQEVQYPAPFSGRASNVHSGITISSAFTNVEKTISALTQELLNDEIVVEKAIDALGNAAGIIDENGVIQYITNTNANYINNAISLADADDILDAAIKNIGDRVENIESDYINGATFNGTPVQVNNHKLVISATTDNIKYNGSSSSTTQVINSISGDVKNLKIDVDFLKANSAHTIVSGGDNVNVTQNNKTYTVNVPTSAITNIAKQSIKVISGTNTTVTEGTEGNAKTFAVNVDLSSYVTKSNITGDTPIIKVVGSGDTIVTSAKEDNKITYTVTTDLSNYAKSADVPKDLGVSGNGTSRTIYLKKSDGTKLGSGVTFDVGNEEMYKGNVSGITINNKTASSTTTGATMLSLTLSASDITYDGVISVQSALTKCITGGTIGAGATYSASVTNGILNLTVPSASTVHNYTGGKYINVSSGDVISYNGPDVPEKLIMDGNTIYLSTSGGTKLGSGVTITPSAAEVYKGNVSAITVNSHTASSTATGATSLTVTIHGHDIKLDTGFTTTTYPKVFTDNYTAATNVASTDTVNQAINKIEKSVSALTQALLDDEDIWATAVQNVCNAAGSIVNNDNKIEYIPDQSCAYIKQATSLHSADAILDQKIVELEFKIDQIIKAITPKS